MSCTFERLARRRRTTRPSGRTRSGNGFTIVSKDGGFSGRSALYGAPTVIWLALGNCSTSEIERGLRGHHDEIETFAAEPDTTLLVIEPAQGVGAP